MTDRPSVLQPTRNDRAYTTKTSSNRLTSFASTIAVSMMLSIVRSILLVLASCRRSPCRSTLVLSIQFAMQLIGSAWSSINSSHLRIGVPGLDLIDLSSIFRSSFNRPSYINSIPFFIIMLVVHLRVLVSNSNRSLIQL